MKKDPMLFEIKSDETYQFYGLENINGATCLVLRVKVIFFLMPAIFWWSEEKIFKCPPSCDPQNLSRGDILATRVAEDGTIKLDNGWNAILSKQKFSS